MFTIYLKEDLIKDSLTCGNCTVSPINQTAESNNIGFQVQSFFSNLFNTNDWPARWNCGTWSDFHGWLYIISDLTIWAAYFAIPILLLVIIKKRKDIPFLNIFWLFIAFILLCGLTHFIDAIIFWWPAYRLSALLRFFTALVSVITVFSLFKLLPIIFKLRTQEELEFEIIERKKAEEETRILMMRQEATNNLMNRKDEFMSIASHELKTPITTLKSSLQLLQRMVSTNKELEPTKMLVDKAARQTKKLTGIINDLLDVTKIQAGKIILNNAEFDLSLLINECAEECEIENKECNVHVRANSDLVVYGDRSRIDQVLCNLITNAIKYSPNSNKVNVIAEKIDNGKVKVSVIDQGIGIPKNHLDDVFDRFFRVENSSQNFAGIGLGLYISSEIIKRHNGEIGVESELGKGSTFWFSI
ncbi:sensor histidine kinase [Pedobacter alpinus]|uniref:histidine kinase n=1 Tax=Pedobacter alpinus TaxID=1590643 RepID=A0ABW5TYN7_9SPHI